MICHQTLHREGLSKDTMFYSFNYKTVKTAELIWKFYLFYIPLEKIIIEINL